MSYEVGVISGKFRILHKGHKEVILKAAKEDIKKLVIICHIHEDYKRYSSIFGLKKALQSILDQTNKPYDIIMTKKKFRTIVEWEEFVMREVNSKNVVMYNSKEDYNNVLLPNKYIKCPGYENVSATEIVLKLKEGKISNEIAPEFLPYLNTSTQTL